MSEPWHMPTAAPAAMPAALPASYTNTELYRYTRVYHTASLALGILGLVAALLLFALVALWQPALNAVNPRYQGEVGWYGIFHLLAYGFGEFYVLYLGLLAVFCGLGGTIYAFVGFGINHALQKQLERNGRHAKTLGYILSVYTLLAGVAVLSFFLYWLDIHATWTALVAGIAFILAALALFTATRKL